MTTETINGLHSCKPGNDPVIGQVKLFVIEQRKGKSGKPYIKIRSANEENGGTPHRILAAEQTNFVDQHGNISFNLEIEPSSSQPTAFQNARATMGQGRVPREEQGMDDETRMVTIKDGIIIPRVSPDSDWPDAQQGKSENALQYPPELDTRQRAIIRQHSQSMALEVLKLKVALNELTVEDLTPKKLCALADYFDQDVFVAVTCTPIK